MKMRCINVNLVDYLSIEKIFYLMQFNVKRSQIPLEKTRIQIIILLIDLNLQLRTIVG